MYERDIYETVRYIKDRFPEPIDVAVVLGSGFNSFVNEIPDRITFHYHNVPHFNDSSIEGHDSLLIFGHIGMKSVMVMDGRFHYYEGYNMEQVTFPIRVMAALGIKTLILTNACGGIRNDLKAGSIVLINDHISLFAPSPLRGDNLDQFGPRFPDMTYVYDAHLRQIVHSVAEANSIKVKEGVYCFAPGPQYETPADIRAFKALGADVCGMSTVPEAIVAVHSGIKVIGLSLVTNKAAGLTSDTITHEEVLSQSLQSARDISVLITQIILHL